tara:strand:+ start:7578 stop:8741 length:1164 start_codon:yes stop_codon:yes gene_type:complete
MAKQFAECGYRDTQHVVDLLHGAEDGMQMVTSFTGASEREILNACGLDAPPEYSGVTLHAPCHIGGVLTPEMDDVSYSGEQYRELNLPDHASLISGLGPPRNQGSVGTCTAFATAAAVESQLYDPSIDVAERFIYWGTKAIDGLPNSEGSLLKFSTQWLLDRGVCYEQTWPYVEDRSDLKLRPSETAFQEALQLQPESRSVLAARNVQGIKAEIADGRGVGLSLPIYKSHYASLRFHSEGRFTMPLGIFDSRVGGHAVCAVAYVDDPWLTANGFDEELGGGAFLVRNSWGEWARKNSLAHHFGAECGYGIVPFRYIEYHCWEAISVTVRSHSFTIRHWATDIRQTARRELEAYSGTWWEKTRGRVVLQAHERLFGSNRQVSGFFQED